MKTQCPHCKSEFTIREEYSGKKVKCPKCNTPFIVDNNNAPKIQNDVDVDTKIHNVSQSTTIEKHNPPEIHLGLIPQKFRQYLNLEEKILYASNPSNGALVLSIALPSMFLIISLFWLFQHAVVGIIPAFIFGFLTLMVYLSWKNQYYVITDKRTFASEGIFNVAVSIIPNKSIQMICINTGIIDKLLGLKQA